MLKTKKILKVLNVIILVALFIMIYTLTISIISCRKGEIPIIITTQDQCLMAYNILNEDYKEFTQSEDVLRQLIAKDFGLKLYSYEKKPITDGYTGKVNLYTRHISIDTNVSGHLFVEVFAHEVMHLKNLVGDERWVCFETFKYLYEHEELHSAGVWYGQLQLQGCWYGEYDIRDLIVDYLTNK